MLDEAARHLGGHQDGVTPRVQFDDLREQLGTKPMRVTGDRVDPQLVAHAPYQSASHGTGSSGARATLRQGPRWSCHRASALKARSALRTNLTAPSGWRQAPRPSTRPASVATRYTIRPRPPR